MVIQKISITYRCIGLNKSAVDTVLALPAPLAEWVGRIGVALQPLSDRLAEILKQGHLLHADETPVQLPDPGKSKTKRAI